MVDPTINNVYHKARKLYDEKRISSELWYAILEMKDAHIREIDLGKNTEYFKESEDKEWVILKNYY